MSETSFKFFIQFVGWTTFYCVFNLIVAAYFLAEYRREVSNFRHRGLSYRLCKAQAKAKDTPAIGCFTQNA